MVEHGYDLRAIIYAGEYSSRPLQHAYIIIFSQRRASMERVQPAKPSHRHTYRCQVRLHDGNENFNGIVNEDYSSLLRLHDADDNCDDVDDKFPTRFLEI